MPIQIHAFTSAYKGISRVLKNNVLISSAVLSNQEDGNSIGPDCREYIALWDTGATGSAITDKIVRECRLNPIGVVEMHGFHGSERVNQYLVNIWLPGKVLIPNVPVAEGKLKDTDVLIGMDIINKGDFAVTNYDEKTVFSYRVPSVERIDFVKKPFKPKPSPQIPGRRKR